ncbi:hypothetical protein C6A77_21335 [Pseudomonas sp. AFG_SD02_1510_Pfu_092]|nr:hypothetical protein C6A77_21335 [Pseudomonas sp. AFG_SD02_1510_Pfu_092]
MFFLAFASARAPCGSGFSREESNAVHGTGCAGVRGHARSHRYRAFSGPRIKHVGTALCRERAAKRPRNSASKL